MKADILFSEVNLPVPDVGPWVEFSEGMADEFWMFDEYRNCNLLPLHTENGLFRKGETGNTGRINEFKWTPFVPEFIRTFHEEHLFPVLDPRPRIYIIRTNPGQKMNLHIDCNRESFGTVQLKLRLNLSGPTGDLFFATREGDLRPPEAEGFFVIDGSWPHGMKNNSENFRYTLALGSPWCGQGLKNSDFIRPLMKSGLSLENHDRYFEV